MDLTPTDQISFFQELDIGTFISARVEYHLTEAQIQQRRRSQVQSVTAIIKETASPSHDPITDVREWYADWISNPINQAAIGAADVPGPTPFTKWYSVKLESTARYPHARQIFDLNESKEYFRNPFLEDRASRHLEIEEEVSPLTGIPAEASKLSLDFTEGWLIDECSEKEEEVEATQTSSKEDNVFSTAFYQELHDQSLCDFSGFHQDPQSNENDEEMESGKDIRQWANEIQADSGDMVTRASMSDYSLSSICSSTTRGEIE